MKKLFQMPKPFFSVIIPCYNHGKYLPECLNSLLTQSYFNWEAIVINDGSQDHTRQIGEDYVLKDNRIRLINKENGGLSSARNKGIQEATGEWFIFLDADDIVEAGALLRIFELAKHANLYCMINYGYNYINPVGAQVLHSVLPVNWTSMIPQIFSQSPGPPHSICINREFALKLGTFDEELRAVEDWDYWIRAAKAGAYLVTIQDPLVGYRYVPGSMSRDAFLMYNSIKKVLFRGIDFDNRILCKSELNKSYRIELQPVLIKLLVRSLGVSVMQGKIHESIDLFKRESPASNADLEPESFGDMCSYLSFRYFYSPSDIKEVFSNIYPRFVIFFNELGYPRHFRRRALYQIFKYHHFHRNLHNFGPFLGMIYNKIIRLSRG